MKAYLSSAASVAHRQPRPGAAQRVRHLVGVVAALSLLVVSTAVWAEAGLGRGVDPATALPTASAEMAAGVRRRQ